MLAFEDARDLVLARCQTLGSEVVGIGEARGRVLAEDVAAPFDLPAWDSSAMDGYALDAQGLERGDRLRVEGFFPAGRSDAGSVSPGMAARILTGAALPAGANCVVPFEQVDDRSGVIRLVTSPRVGDHIRRQGSDVSRGDVVLEAGAVLGHPEIAILASINRTSVAVGRRPRVAILSTGDELLTSGEPLRPGCIFDSNGPALAAATVEAGGCPSLLGIAADDPDLLRDSLREGLRADVLVTSAGVSAGDRDLVRATLTGLGVEEIFWSVAIQPGRPVAFAVADGCLVFSLPGNPVAALLTFALLVRPALRRLLGHREPVEVIRRAVLGEDVRPRPDRMTLRRVGLEWVDGRLVATGCGPQATGHLLTLARADGIALIPAGPALLPEGSPIDIHPLRPDGDFSRRTRGRD